MNYEYNLVVGEIITIELIEKGTAGYLWNFDLLDGKIVKKLHKKILVDDSNSVGGFQKISFTLEGISVGIVTLIEKRPFSEDVADTCMITVKPE